MQPAYLMLLLQSQFNLLVIVVVKSYLDDDTASTYKLADWVLQKSASYFDGTTSCFHPPSPHSNHSRALEMIGFAMVKLRVASVSPWNVPQS